MIAVPNEIPFLIFSSSCSGLTVTLVLLKATHMPPRDLQFSAGVDRTPRLKLAVQGGSVEQGTDEVVAVVGPVRESDPVQGLDGVKCCGLI